MLNGSFCIHGVQGGCDACHGDHRRFVRSIKRLAKPGCSGLSDRQIAMFERMSGERKGIVPNMTRLPEYPDFEAYRLNFLALIDAEPMEAR